MLVFSDLLLRELEIANDDLRHRLEHTEKVSQLRHEIIERQQEEIEHLSELLGYGKGGKAHA